MYSCQSVPLSEDPSVADDVSLYMCCPLSSVALELLTGPKVSSELSEPPSEEETGWPSPGAPGVVASWSKERREMKPGATPVGVLHVAGPTQVVPPTWYQALSVCPESSAGVVRVTTTADPAKAATGTCSAVCVEPQVAASCDTPVCAWVR